MAKQSTFSSPPLLPITTSSSASPAATDPTALKTPTPWHHTIPSQTAPISSKVSHLSPAATTITGICDTGSLLWCRSWRGTAGKAAERWLFYHWGELRVEMSPWVKMLVEAGMGEKVKIEDLEETGEGLFCFERAVVFRHNEGGMGMEGKKMVYGMMRCKARAFCRLGSVRGEGDGMVRVTLLMRKGARSFKDERTVVVKIFDRECGKVEGCRFKVTRPNNLTFCDQVKLITETDILASPHGAQLTNMFFMDTSSRVMEFFPKGWKEFAGVGQHAFQWWIADASGIKHQGPWHDTNGAPCPHTDNSKCFRFYKNGQIGHDEAFFSNWTAMIIREMWEYKVTEEYRYAQQELKSRNCLCAS